LRYDIFTHLRIGRNSGEHVENKTGSYVSSNFTPWLKIK